MVASTRSLVFLSFKIPLDSIHSLVMAGPKRSAKSKPPKSKPLKVYVYNDTNTEVNASSSSHAHQPFSTVPHENYHVQNSSSTISVSREFCQRSSRHLSDALDPDVDIPFQPEDESELLYSSELADSNSGTGVPSAPPTKRKMHSCVSHSCIIFAMSSINDNWVST